MSESWKIPKERIVDMAARSKEVVMEPFPCITVVSWQLPSGFVITEQSGTIDPAEYDREIGIECCRERLIDKVWELEGYVQKQRWANQRLHDAEEI